MMDVKSKSAGCKARILSEIVLGVWHENDRFPSERELCERHQVSRSTIRQAVEELIQEGLLARRGKVGAFVASNAVRRAAELSRGKDCTMSAAWIMNPGEIVNPLLQTVFNTCSDYLEPGIRLSIRFGLMYEIPERLEQYAAAVVCCKLPPEQLLRLRRTVANVIVLNVRNPDGNYLMPDNFGGGRLMAEHALRNGHDRACCLANLTGGADSDFGQRYQGIKSVYDEHGLVLETALMDQHYYMEPAANTHYALETMLRRSRELSMVLCSWDLLAFGVMESLTLRNLKVPEDISLIGFDDQCYARAVEPGLTTVKYPSEAIGIKLAEYLNAVERGGTPQLQETVRPLLIERNSVRNLNINKENQ